MSEPGVSMLIYLFFENSRVVGFSLVRYRSYTFSLSREGLVNQATPLVLDPWTLSGRHCVSALIELPTSPRTEKAELLQSAS